MKDLSLLEEGDLVPTWTMLMKYPNIIHRMNKDVWDILNTLQELFPIRYYRSKVDTFLLWYAKGMNTGLITAQEDLHIKAEMVHGAGGM
jgi:hypothetical protein